MCKNVALEAGPLAGLQKLVRKIINLNSYARNAQR